MVKWSPSVMGFKHRDSVGKMRELYPPFLRTEHPDPSEVRMATIEPLKIEFAHRLKKRMSVTDITEGRFVEIGDRELLRDGKDYRWWEQEEFGEDATDRDEEKTRHELLWTLDRCKTYSALSKHEEEPDTTDPYLSHQLNEAGFIGIARIRRASKYNAAFCLKNSENVGNIVTFGADVVLACDVYLPYNHIPRPRNFTFADPEIGYEATVLPRRPRSPVRTVLPGKFDLRAAFEERDRIHRLSETREQLREAKERIARSIQQLPFDPSNLDQVIVTLVLETICEEVTLLMMDVRIDIDVRTFANAALFWALRDVNIVGIEVLLEEEYLLMNRYRFANIEHGIEAGHMLKPNGTRRMLLSAIHAPFSRSNWATLHRRLPWPHVCPAHEKGHPQYYPNVRSRIDETLTKGDDRVAARTSYASDLTCYHFEDVSNNADVAYKRKSKSAAAEHTSLQIIRALLVDVVDFK